MILGPQVKYLNSDTTFLSLAKVAQTAKGPAWHSYDYGDVGSSYEGDVENTHSVTNLASFSSENATMEVNGEWVNFKYLFQDFVGTSLRPAGWEITISTSCRRFEVVNIPSNNSDSSNLVYYKNFEGATVLLPLDTVNYTRFPRRIYGTRYRWIVIQELSMDPGPLTEFITKRTPRDEITEICELKSS